MKKSLCTLLTVTILLISINTAMADAQACIIQGNITPPTQILQTIQNMGYTPIKGIFTKSIKLSDSCIYKVSARDQTGQKWKLYFDPITGNLIAKKQDDFWD